MGAGQREAAGGGREKQPGLGGVLVRSVNQPAWLTSSSVNKSEKDEIYPNDNNAQKSCISLLKALNTKCCKSGKTSAFLNVSKF